MKPPAHLIAKTVGRDVPAPAQTGPVVREYVVDVGKVEEQAARAVATPPAPPQPISDYLWEDILGHLAAGMPLANACRLAGLEPRRVSELLKARPDMANQAHQAKNQLLKEMIGVVVAKARDGEYRAAQWVVGRLDPEKPKNARAAAPRQPTLSMASVEAIKNKSLEDLRNRTQ